MYPGECTIVAALVEDPLPGYPRDAAGRPQVPVTVGANQFRSRASEPGRLLPTP